MTKPNDAVRMLREALTIADNDLTAWIRGEADASALVTLLHITRAALADTAAIQDATEPPEQTAQGAGIAQPNLILCLPKDDKRQLLIKWDQTKEGVRMVCLQIKEAEQTAQGDAELSDDEIKSIARANGHPCEGFYVSFLERDLIWFARRLLLQSPASDAQRAAERYQFIRQHSRSALFDMGIDFNDPKELLDSKVDAAIAAQAALKDSTS